MRCYNMFQFSFFLSLAVFVCGDKFESLFSSRNTTVVVVNHHNDIDGDYVDDGEFATPCLST